MNNEEEMIQKIQIVMRTVFDDDAITIDKKTSPDDIAEWDSFANIQLIAAIESMFHHKFTTAQASAFRTVGDILNALQSA